MRTERARLRALALLAVAVLLAAACTTPSQRWQPEPGSAGSEHTLRDCHAHLIERPGPGELADERVWYRPAAQPYFAIDRLHGSFAPDTLDPAALAAWREGVAARSRQDLAAWLLRSRGEVSGETLACLDLLVSTTTQAAWADYAAAAAAHSQYRHGRRLLGLYPAIAPVVAWRIRTLQRDWRTTYGEAPNGPLRLYRPLDWETVPAVADGSIAASTLPAQAPTPETVQGWLAEAVASSPLGLPQLHPERLAALFAVHAPEWVSADSDPAGALGQVVADHGQARFDAAEAVVYLDHGIARLASGNHLQLSYAVWFAERTPTRAIDLYGGRWNGVIWRVTLDHDGQVLWYDSLHQCGCYHQVWLGPGHQPSPERGLESPLYLPLDWSGRPRLVLAPGSHHIVAVTSAEQPLDSADVVVTHRLRPEWQHSLLTLRDNGAPGGHTSLYDRSGLVADSHRLERWVLWPFGIPAPGTMRRPGTHAIAFVGQRHFDDPRLFDTLVRARADGQRSDHAQRSH